MKELLLCLGLLLPPPATAVDWQINLIPAQLQLKHEDGLQVSYSYRPVGCAAIPIRDEMIFKGEAGFCYLINTNQPVAVRYTGWITK